MMRKYVPQMLSSMQVALPAQKSLLTSTRVQIMTQLCCRRISWGDSLCSVRSERKRSKTGREYG
jgi:hypothetical protein